MNVLFLHRKYVSPNIIYMVVLVPLFYQLCILPGDLRIKHARPLFASEIRQQLCVVLLVQRKAREQVGSPVFLM